MPGVFSTTMLVLGSMAALTNGAAVQIWNQKPSPLMAVVFQNGEAQKGNSRLFTVLEDIFEACDDVVAERVQALLAAAPEDASISQVTPQTVPQPVVVKSIALQSFTWPEFFYRCSSGFLQVEFEDGDARAKHVSEVWLGRAFNVDESYELFDGLNLMGGTRSDKDKAPSVHASTLNTLITAGKTRRATRSSTTFGDTKGKRVSLAILGNAHPNKWIPIGRAMVGSHTACTKERFIICLDRAKSRHDALPSDVSLPEGVSPWTSLPLTPQQAAAFGWEAVKLTVFL